MANAAKTQAVAEIKSKFESSNAAVVTEYRGLTVTQLTTLRRALGAGTEYAIAKNTLVKIAAAEAGVEGIDDLLVGPTAIAFIGGDPVEAAKALRDFAKANAQLIIKGGLLDGKPVGVAEVTKLADLESREVLLAKMAGAMKGSLTKAAVLFAQLPSQTARLAQALADKRAAEGSAAA